MLWAARDVGRRGEIEKRPNDASRKRLYNLCLIGRILFKPLNDFHAGDFVQRPGSIEKDKCDNMLNEITFFAFKELRILVKIIIITIKAS